MTGRNRLKLHVAAVLALALGAAAWIAEDVAAQDPAPEESLLAISAARVMDVTSGEMLTDSVVLVRGDLIEAIVASGAVPPEAKPIDLGDRTLLPGLIDAHTHLTYDQDWLRPRLGKHPMTPPAERALVGARNAARTLRAGFTTVRDLGTCCFADVTLSRAVAEGLIEGPEIVPSGHVITTTGGDCDQTMAMPTVFDGGPEYGIADGPEAIAHAVRSQIRGGAKVIKTCADRGNYEEAELKIMADIAHRKGLKLAVHIWEAETVRAAVLAGADSIEHLADFDDDTLDLMAERGVFLVPTVHVTDGIFIDHLPQKVQDKITKEMPMYHAAFRRAIDHGVRIAFGSDVGEFDNGQNALEFAALVRWGLSPLATLQAATTQAAELLGFADRGRIEVGLRADLVAVAGNPVTDISVMENVEFVMKAGQIIVRP